MDKDNPLVIETDATFCETEKVAGISAVLFGADGSPVLTMAKQVPAENVTEGELKAILYAIEEIPSDGGAVSIVSDNRNAILLLNGDATTSKDDRRLVYKVWNRVKQKSLTVTYTWRPRSGNSVADAVAAFAARRGDIWARI